MRHKETKKKMSDNKGTTKLPNQMSLYIRIFAAVYLVYLAISFGDVWNRYTGMELIFYLLAMIGFGVIGLLLGGLSIKDLVVGNYVGGKNDKNPEEIAENK